MKKLLATTALLLVVLLPPIFRFVRLPRPGLCCASFSWTGFLRGVNAGYANTKNRSSYSYEGTQPGGAFATGSCSGIWLPGSTDSSAASNPCYPYPLIVPSNNTDTSLAGNQQALANSVANGYLPTSLSSGSDGVFMGGVQLGYNYQIGSFVIGVEGDWNYLGADSSRSWEGPTSGDFNRGITYNPANLTVLFSTIEKTPMLMALRGAVLIGSRPLVCALALRLIAS